MGLAASMGAFLLTAGAKGKRLSLPNSRIMIHQPLGGARGQAVDIEIQAKEILYHKRTLNKLLSEHTGQPLEKIEQDTERDFFMSPAMATTASGVSRRRARSRSSQTIPPAPSSTVPPTSPSVEQDAKPSTSPTSEVGTFP
jgi:hypothetical protein